MGFDQLHEFCAVVVSWRICARNGLFEVQETGNAQTHKGKVCNNDWPCISRLGCLYHVYKLYLVSYFSVQFGDTNNIPVRGCLLVDHAFVRCTVRHWNGVDLCSVRNTCLLHLRQMEKQTKSIPGLC